MVTEEYVGVSLNLSSKKSAKLCRRTLQFSNRNQLGRHHSIDFLRAVIDIESLCLQLEKSGQVDGESQEEDDDVGDEPTVGRNISGEVQTVGICVGVVSFF